MDWDSSSMHYALACWTQPVPCKEGKVTPQGKLASSSFGLKLVAVQPSMEHHVSELIDYMYLYELTYTCAMYSNMADFGEKVGED